MRLFFLGLLKAVTVPLKYALTDTFLQSSKTVSVWLIKVMKKTLCKQPPEVFYKKALLKNFAIFTGNHQCWSLFWIKLQTFSSATSLKWDSNIGVFLWILLNFNKNAYFEEYFFFEHLFWRIEVFQQMSMVKSRFHKVTDQTSATLVNQGSDVFIVFDKDVLL